MKVAIYIRVSTKLQEERYSLSAQKLELTRYANEQDWTIVDIYKDVDSGGKFHKPGLERLMDDVEEGNIDIVLCVDQDRLSRLDTIEWELLKSTLRENNVKIAEPGRIVDLENLDDEFVSDIKNLIAKREKKMIVRRMTRGLKQFTREGKIYGRQPDEYINVDGKLTINEKYAKIIRLIDDLYVNKGWGISRIAHYLNHEGIRTANNTNWYPIIVRKKLQNPAYSGTLRRTFGNETIEVPDVYPKIRTEEMYRKIMQNFGNRTKQFLDAAPHFLRHVPIRCEDCGKKIAIIKVNKNFYLSHSTKDFSMCLHRREYLNAERLRKPFEIALRNITESEELAKKYFEDNQEEQNSTSIEADIKLVQSQLNNAKKKMDNLIDLYLDDHFDKATLNKRRASIEADVINFEKRIDDLKKQLMHKAKEVSYLDILSEYRNIVLKLNLLEESDKQNLISSLFTQATFNFGTEELILSLSDFEDDVTMTINAIDERVFLDSFTLKQSAERYEATQKIVDANPDINFKKLCTLSPHHAETLLKDAERFGWWRGLKLRRGSKEAFAQQEQGVRKILKQYPDGISSYKAAELLHMSQSTYLKALKRVKEKNNEKT